MLGKQGALKAAAVQDAEDLRQHLAAAEFEKTAELAKARAEMASQQQKHQEELLRYAHEAADATKLAADQKAAAVEEAEDLKQRLVTAESERAAETARAMEQAAVQQQRHEEELRLLAQALADTDKLAEEQKAAAVGEAEDLRQQLAAAKSERAAELARAREEVADQQQKHEEELRRLTQATANTTRLAKQQNAAAVQEAESFRQQLAAIQSERAMELPRATDEAVVQQQKHEEELRRLVQATAHATRLVKEQKTAAVEETNDIRQQLAAVESKRAAELARATDEAAVLQQKHEEELRSFVRATANADKRAEDAVKHSKQKELQLDEHLAAADADMAAMRQQTNKLSRKLAHLESHHEASVKKANDRITALHKKTWELRQEMAAMAGRVAGANSRATAAESRERLFASQLAARRAADEKKAEIGEAENGDCGKNDVDAVLKRAEAANRRGIMSVVRCRESTALLQMTTEGFPEVTIAEGDRFGVFHARLQEIEGAAEERVAKAEIRAAALESDNARLRALLVAAESDRDADGEVATMGGTREEAEERKDEEETDEGQVWAMCPKALISDGGVGGKRAPALLPILDMLDMHRMSDVLLQFQGFSPGCKTLTLCVSRRVRKGESNRIKKPTLDRDTK